MLFQALAFTIACYVVAFVKAWLLTFIASVSLPFILIVYGILIPPYLKIHKVTENHHDDATSLAYEIFSSIRIIVAFGAEAKLARQHEVLLKRAEKNERSGSWLVGLFMTPTMLVMYGTFGLTFWFGVRQVSRGDIDSLGDIIV